MKTFIDLFSGIGGFHRALRKRGLECVFASDIDKLACESYEANFGFKPHGDIMAIPAEQIPAHDVLCAGFPCQPFSVSGNQGGVADERGRLFYEIVRIADFHKPSVIILENVIQVLTIDDGAVKLQIYEMLERIGYHVSQSILNSGDFGVPQQRQRVYFVAIRKDSGLVYREPQPFSAADQLCLNDVIIPDCNTDDLLINRDDIHFYRNIKDFRCMQPNQIGYVSQQMQGYRVYSQNGHAITQTANGGGLGRNTGLYRIGDVVRRLHIDEAKRVMGFDVDHKVGYGANGYRQLGNSVVPAVITAVFDGICEADAFGNGLLI